MTDNLLKCPGCGETVESGTKFCAKCGAAIPEAPPEAKPNFCSSCGKSVDPGITFCPGCGSKIGDKPAAAGGKEVTFKLPEGITLPNRFEIIPGPVLYAGGAAAFLVFISLFLPWIKVSLGMFGSASGGMGCVWQFFFFIFLLVGVAALVLKPTIHWVFLGVGVIGVLLCLIFLASVSGNSFGMGSVGFGFIIGLLGQLCWLATFGLAFMEQKK